MGSSGWPARLSPVKRKLIRRISRASGLKGNPGALVAGCLLRRDLDEPAERIREAQLFRRAGRHDQELRAAHEHGEAAGTGDGDVQPVARVEEVDVSRSVG